MKKVFLAGPYQGKHPNVLNMMKYADRLFNRGFNVFNPLLYHYQNKEYSLPEEHWYTIDLDWVPVCDILLRIPGDSLGADREVKLANELGIPVYTNLYELLTKEKP